MGTVKFTQFLRPNGVKKQINIAMPQDICDKAEEMIKSGVRFEIEELMSGMVNMDCTYQDDDEPLHIELCPNGPAVVKSVEKLVNESYKKWRKL